ncbi:hypothetical protein LB507_006803 [Fusarium sp. FIESC RH6]|nr:hypothetical protein LB507_006803 [Fusarium sp. FIESC RH6]
MPQYRQSRESTENHKKKSDAYGKVGIRRSVLFMLHHQIDVLRSFVLLHDSPSARLADRLLMIHELRGSNPTPYEVPHILCSLIVRFRTGTFPFLYTLYSGVLLSTRKRPGCLWFQYQSFGMGGIWEGLERLTAVLIPASKCHRNWHKACICTVTEKEEKKDLFWFCWLFFLASATRNGYKNISYSGLLHYQGGNASRTEGFNILLCILRMRPDLTSTEDHVPPLWLFLVRIETDTSNHVPFFLGLLSMLFFCLLEEMECFGEILLAWFYWERQVADENEVTILMIINNLGSLNGPPWRFAPSGSR